jgi:hypothetical protein
MRTSLYSILCIGIRLAAVLIAVSALLSLPAAYNTLTHGEWSRNELGWIFALWTLVLLFALFFWVYPGVLARLAAGKASQQVFESPIGADELQYIAFSVVGLWIFAGGLIDVTQLVIRELLVEHMLRNNTGGLDAEGARARVISAFVEVVVRIVAGGVLMLRARGLVGLLRSMRHAGQPSTIDEEAVSDGSGTDKENA